MKERQVQKLGTAAAAGGFGWALIPPDARVCTLLKFGR